MTPMFSFVFCLAGVIALCLAMRRHWNSVFPQRPYQPGAALMLRVLGSSALLLAAVFPAAAYGTGVGLVVFLGLLTVAHFALAVALPYLGFDKSRQRSV
ncbi:MAG: DUF3325 domain-containing protein [Pseudomonadota bacterium]